MRPVINILLVMAVLLCGLHLSPAEADEGPWTAETASAAVDPDGTGAEDHSQPHAVHSCHGHCPTSDGVNAVRSADTRLVGTALHYPAAVAPLESAAQAPPVEPPAA